LDHYLGRSPSHATAEELRDFQLSMVNDGVSGITLNATITGLNFLFTTTLNRPDVMLKMSTVPVPRKLPEVLNLDETARLITAAGNPKYRAALCVAYGAGLRVSEVVSLKVSDIDRDRMALRVEQGKGHKDRYTLLSPALLDYLEAWWHFANKHGQMFKGSWLFPGANPINHMTSRHLSRAFHAAANDAGITKHVSMHSLRHSFATHLLEANVDIRIIQVLLGHKKLETTALYAQVATEILRDVISPLDALNLKSS
jgi:site-specific recombinase XerD